MEEKELEQPKAEAEATKPADTEVIDEDFTDVKKPEEVKAEPVAEPEPQSEVYEPEPQPEDSIKDASSYQYGDPRLEAIEKARMAWNKDYKKWNIWKIVMSVVVLVMIIAGYTIPYFTISDATQKSKWTLICAAICAAVGIVGLAVFGIFQRKANRKGINSYFNVYYTSLNEYSLSDLGITNIEGNADCKIASSEVDSCGLYPGAKHIGSRDNVTFNYDGVDFALCDMAAQKDEGKGLSTVFVGKYLRANNNLAISPEGLVIYFKGNSRAIPPLCIKEMKLIQSTKRYDIYGDPSNKWVLDSELMQLIKEIRTSKLLVDVAISIKPGRTYFALGYEDTLMILPNDKPFNPAYIEAYKPQMELFIKIASEIAKKQPTK